MRELESHFKRAVNYGCHPTKRQEGTWTKRVRKAKTTLSEENPEDWIGQIGARGRN